MYSHDGGPVLLYPQQPPPPPPPPLCSFVHIVPQYTMVEYPPQPSPLVFTPGGGAFLEAAAKEVRAEVRDVWAGNFNDELSKLSAVLPHYPWVCVDTEFPGVVHDSDAPRYLRGPRESYALVKKNVDDLKLLQVGIALSGPAGRFPVAWQFNLRGFDLARHPYAPASIALLRAQGMDFATMNEFGIAPDDFAVGFHRSGLACGQLTWTAFSGSYDFVYLAKVLTGGQPLPGTLDGFLALVRQLFGRNVLDVKHLARCCAMRGGLEQVAVALGVERTAGRAHCAGSDSLLTTDVLLAMLNRFFMNADVLAHAGTIVDLA
jgi:CCR4-NOT transcription complex subunit 7/8